MPLLEIAPTKKVVATLTLEESTAANVDKYAGFINANADDVVTQALDYVFNRDKELQKFLESADGKKAPACFYEFEIKVGQSGADGQQQKRSIKARDMNMISATYKSHAFSGIGYAIRIAAAAFGVELGRCFASV